MIDEYGLTVAGSDASPEARAAYSAAWCKRANAARQERSKVLHAELCEKVSVADGQRALAAFKSVLAAAGTDAWAASLARLKLEYWDICGFAEDEALNGEEGNAAHAWIEAVGAARVELCDKAPHVSAEAFALVDFLGRSPYETSLYAFPIRSPKV